MQRALWTIETWLRMWRDGDPYDDVINALQANPTMTGAQLASSIANVFHASYNNDQSSTTRSAYDMAAFSAFESSLNTLANTLTANVNTLASSLGVATANSQKYAFPQLTDIVNFLDSLNARVTDQGLKTQIANARSAATSSTFRITNQNRNGTSNLSNNVDRSSGLHIVMPSRQTFDAMASAGPASMASYTAQYSGKPWTTFLTAWIGAANRLFFDQGESRWELYLVWEAANSYAEAGQIAAAMGDLEGMLLARIGDAKVAIDRGRLREARALLDDCIAQTEAVDSLISVRSLAIETRAGLADLSG